MSASFFKRLASALFDFLLVFLVVYLAFIIGGRTLLQNRIEYFDEHYGAYMEILDAYNDDLEELQTEYNANVTLANGDAELEAIALENFNSQVEVLRIQNNIDIEPYNDSLTEYFLSIIYFFSIGIIILMTLLTSLTVGKTPGRRILKVSLVKVTSQGEEQTPNALQVFLHDVVLKYFFVIIVFSISLYLGLLLIMLTLITDMILMSITKNKSTIRDYLMKLKVIKN